MPCWTGFYEAFEKYLIGDLAPVDFADLYAQTITYGLFAARTRAQNGFNRRSSAFDSIPHTIGVLRDLFPPLLHRNDQKNHPLHRTSDIGW